MANGTGEVPLAGAGERGGKIWGGTICVDNIRGGNIWGGRLMRKCSTGTVLCTTYFKVDEQVSILCTTYFKVDKVLH
jgi:hypothetical protein